MLPGALQTVIDEEQQQQQQRELLCVTYLRQEQHGGHKVLFISYDFDSFFGFW